MYVREREREKDCFNCTLLFIGAFIIACGVEWSGMGFRKTKSNRAMGTASKFKAAESQSQSKHGFEKFWAFS